VDDSDDLPERLGHRDLRAQPQGRVGIRRVVRVCRGVPLQRPHVDGGLGDPGGRSALSDHNVWAFNGTEVEHCNGRSQMGLIHECGGDMMATGPDVTSLVKDHDEVMEPRVRPNARPLPESASASASASASTNMETLRISLLGPFEVRDGNRLVRLSGMKQRALLCWLALNPGTSVSVDALIAALWGDASPSTARAKVHTHVSELRKALRAVARGHAPGWPVLTCLGGYQLSDDVDLDSRRFQGNASEARRAGRLGDHARASRLFARALEIWRGPALADVTSYAVQAAANALNEERLLAIASGGEWPARPRRRVLNSARRGSAGPGRPA
jgi:DNA-binding winged helix-turn-helix (wHTH) protein